MIESDVLIRRVGFGGRKGLRNKPRWRRSFTEKEIPDEGHRGYARH